MKKLVMLLSAALIFTAFVSSPVLAARPTFENRINYIFTFIYRNVYLYPSVYMMPVGLEEIDAVYGGSWGPTLGGDADDYADGRVVPPVDPKPANRILNSIIGGDAKGNVQR